MVFLSYRWMGHDYWGYGCNDCTLYYYERIHFIVNDEICKTKYLTAHHICHHFRNTHRILFILRQHTILNPERNDIIRLYRTTRSYYFFCIYITCTISIFSVIRGPLCHCNGAYLKPKPDEGKPELKLVHEKKENIQ